MLIALNKHHFTHDDKYSGRMLIDGHADIKRESGEAGIKEYKKSFWTAILLVFGFAVKIHDTTQNVTHIVNKNDLKGLLKDNLTNKYQIFELKKIDTYLDQVIAEKQKKDEAKIKAEEKKIALDTAYTALVKKAADHKLKFTHLHYLTRTTTVKTDDKVGLIKRAIAEGIAINDQTNDLKLSPLHFAVIDWLLERNFSDEEMKMLPPNLSQTYPRSWDIVKALVKSGANLNAEDIKGNTPLWYTIGISLDYLQPYLIEQGASINHVNRNGDTVLIKALKNMILAPPSKERKKVVDFLISKGADIHLDEAKKHGLLVLALEELMFRQNPEFIDIIKFLKDDLGFKLDKIAHEKVFNKHLKIFHSLSHEWNQILEFFVDLGLKADKVDVTLIEAYFNAILQGWVPHPHPSLRAVELFLPRIPKDNPLNEKMNQWLIEAKKPH